MPAILAQSWVRKIPSIVSLDATPLQYDELGSFYRHEKGPAWLEALKWRLNRDCFRLARHVVTWSEWAKQGLVDEYEVPVEKISVIPPGVDFRAWTPSEPATSKFGPVRILFVGGDMERKGGSILLEAFRQLRAQLPPRLTGNGNAAIELHLVTRASVKPEPGVVVYSDLQPNSAMLKELFFRSDIFCLPTLGDCLPMVLSEAGAAGLPTVSTRIAGIPEIIQDGETGFLVPPGDVQALTAALQCLIEDPKLRLRQGQAARQVLEQRYAPALNVLLVEGGVLQLVDAQSAPVDTAHGADDAWCVDGPLPVCDAEPARLRRLPAGVGLRTAPDPGRAAFFQPVGAALSALFPARERLAWERRKRITAGSMTTSASQTAPLRRCS